MFRVNVILLEYSVHESNLQYVALLLVIKHVMLAFYLN